MILLVFVYISMPFQSISLACVVSNLFIPVNNESFGLEIITFFSCTIEGMTQPIIFQGSIWKVLFWTKVTQACMKLTSNPKNISPKRVTCTLCSFVLGSFRHFWSWRNNIPIVFSIFNGVSRCPNSCFHYYYLLIPYFYQSRQLSWMSGDHKVCVCYLRFLNFVACYNLEKLVSIKLYNFDQKLTTDFEKILTFCLPRGLDLVLSLSVMTPLITPVMGISWPCSFGKVSYDMLKSIGFRD